MYNYLCKLRQGLYYRRLVGIFAASVSDQVSCHTRSSSRAP